MKKTYQKPVLEAMNLEEQENMLAASNSLKIFEETSLGASNALSNEESDFNVWE